jgi:ribosomal protein S18 acetylase RimI-like enzyme
VQVRAKTGADAEWVYQTLVGLWGGSLIVLGGGRIVDAARLPALIAGAQQGLATYEVAADGRSAVLVTLNALTPQLGIGTALIEALSARLAAIDVGELQVSTTNDNIDAIRFYQRRGFRFAGVYPGEIDAARRVKPSIPLIGHYGIAMRDRIDLVRAIGAG